MMVRLLASLSFVDGVPSTRYFVTKRSPEDLTAPGVALWLVAVGNGENEEAARLDLRTKLQEHPVMAKLCDGWLRKDDEPKWDIVRKALRKAADKLQKHVGKKNGHTEPDSQEA